MSDDLDIRGYRAATDYITSAGPVIAAMCAQVLDAVDEIDLDDSYPEDSASEIADGAVPYKSADIMAAAAESAEIFAGPNDRGLLGEGSTPEQQIIAALYELASNVARARLYERQQEADADE